MSTVTRARDTGTSVALRVAAGIPVPVDVAARLEAGGRALEIDCGGGLGCLALAEAFPAARVVGFDREPEAIARAQGLARASGLDARVTFAIAGSIRLPRAAFDLAAVRAVSSRDDALQVLNDIRNALLPDGVCLLVEPAAETAPRARDAIASTLAALAHQAGFHRLDLSCREPTFDIYELRR